VELCVIDTPGFGDGMKRDQAVLPICKYLDDQHELFLRREASAQRSPSNLADTRVHACLYFIPPWIKSLRQMDIEAMKALSQRVNLIPVIAKSDSLSRHNLQCLKEEVRKQLKTEDILVYSCPLEQDDEETNARNLDLMSSMPYAVISSESEVVLPDGRRVLGRQYKWGVSEVENEAHCDYKKLRSLLIRTHMHDLITTTQDIHYEMYRSNRLKNSADLSIDPSAMSQAREKFETQLKSNEQKFRDRLAEKVKQEDARFRQWEQRLVNERSRLMKNLEQEHQVVKALAKEIELIETRASNGRREVAM